MNMSKLIFLLDSVKAINLYIMTGLDYSSLSKTSLYVMFNWLKRVVLWFLRLPAYFLALSMRKSFENRSTSFNTVNTYLVVLSYGSFALLEKLSFDTNVINTFENRHQTWKSWLYKLQKRFICIKLLGTYVHILLQNFITYLFIDTKGTSLRNIDWSLFFL